MANNLAELRTENAELAAQVETDVRAMLTDEQNNAVDAERKRIQSIDEIAGLFDSDIVNEAKYGNPCTAAEMALRAAQKAAKAGSEFMKNLAADSKESGANGVPSANAGTGETPAEPNTPEAKMELARHQVRMALGKDKEE